MVNGREMIKVKLQSEWGAGAAGAGSIWTSAVWVLLPHVGRQCSLSPERARVAREEKRECKHIWFHPENTYMEFYFPQNFSSNAYFSNVIKRWSQQAKFIILELERQLQKTWTSCAHRKLWLRSYSADVSSIPMSSRRWPSRVWKDSDCSKRVSN